MKFLGKLKPFLIPLGLGIVGALIYERWIKSKLPAFLTGTATLLMLTLALAFATPDLRAEVLNKGGAMYLRPLNRETANFSYTNGVPNPGLPALLRVSTWQATNHLIVTTNGQLAVVNLGTNHIGFSGTVFNPSNVMFFRNGLLITTNSFQSP